VDSGTAFSLIGQTVSLVIDGKRVDGFKRGGGFTPTITLLMPTPVGERNRRSEPEAAFASGIGS